ncbi:uncharacterized protein N7518_007058 [Penicillium psychrosexuale]|uniref:uncharacterized protein n=1 Tax=Penicillium psychrosexuale TaxID=1002107 RepID=UPI0025456F9A|nr:uncharacterized protein N7518_007058 [Penicillium psychrosexuale]KAJ5790047.1 hypothetical protein N7518_007058 [Penicillium psychrosexuale]
MQQQKAFSDWLSPNKPSISATDSDIQVTNTPYCGQEDPIQDGSEGELAIPIGHTTAAHNLLSWPSVQSLIHPLKRSGEYVMELEANRGLITAYDEDGVGNPSDDSQVLVPPATENGRLDIELSGRFNANSSTTQRYYQSYLSNIHKVHPFLDQTELSMQVDDFTQYYCSENFSSQIQPRVEGTIYNAIILLVLAIGAFCDQPSPLTFPSTDTPIAGLSLYGFAVSTLGPSQGGTNLKHAQACLLAGIYIGQFAHPFQSYSWISQASWVCQLLIRPKRYRILHSSVKDLCRFIYWTCLKLESNILAELDLPPSGLSRFESQIDLPTEKSALTDSPDSPLISTMLFYSAHIHLRKILNRVHTELYKFDHEEQGWSLTVQQALSMNLARWRASLPYMMKWGDDEQPATEINTARMRAKFYGAQYIIYRPLLYRALHSPPGAKEGLPQPLLDACKICIKSAILNTMAFDRIEGRLIITNIFGTAHGQFGNMLVLSATYMSNLRELVDRDLLQRLLEGTIRFLQHTGSGSPSLQADMEILTEIYGKIFTPSIGS